MARWVARCLALAIVIAYGSVVFKEGGALTPATLQLWLALLVPLALIWFPEQVGSFTGYVGRGGNIDTETPPFLVSLMGWLFLIGLPLVAYFLR